MAGHPRSLADSVVAVTPVAVPAVAPPARVLLSPALLTLTIPTLLLVVRRPRSHS
jgi:hypothetical protein